MENVKLKAFIINWRACWGPGPVVNETIDYIYKNIKFDFFFQPMQIWMLKTSMIFLTMMYKVLTF